MSAAKPIASSPVHPLVSLHSTHARAQQQALEIEITGAEKTSIFLIVRLDDGGWRVSERRADHTDTMIADFVSHRDAYEWVKWKQGIPELNRYADRQA